jgi:hypothetical protein
VNIKGTIYNCKNMCAVIDGNEVNIMMPSFGLIKEIFSAATTAGAGGARHRLKGLTCMYGGPRILPLPYIIL